MKPILLLTLAQYSVSLVIPGCVIPGNGVLGYPGWRHPRGRLHPPFGPPGSTPTGNYPWGDGGQPVVTEAPAESSESDSVQLPTRTLVASEATTSAGVLTTVGPSGTVQSLENSVEPETGTVVSTLETEGHVTTQPLLTSDIPEPTSLISATATSFSTPSASALSTPIMGSGNIFGEPISTDAPPSNVAKENDHPVPRLGVTGKGPFQTNKFYSSFYLGNQSSPVYLFPYTVQWAQGRGGSGSWGMAVSRPKAEDRVYGQTDAATGAAKYYINPVGIHSLVLSAEELGASTALTMDNLTDSSVRVSLHATPQSQPVIQFPLVQGAGFVTALYDGSVPQIQTGVFYKTVTRSTQEAKVGTTKYKLHLEDGTKWLLYAYHTKGGALDLQVVNNGLAISKKPFYGVIQVAEDPGNAESMYDKACGAYCTGVELSGSVGDTSGSYTFNFQKAGMPNATLVMYALPHHQSSFDGATKGKMSNNVTLQTTTKGLAAAVLADSWTMTEQLPNNLGFVPWSPQAGSVATLSNNAKKTIQNIAIQEVSQNMLEQTNQDSMYFSGKALAKFATILMAVNDMVGDQDLAQKGLSTLKVAFARFAENKQKYPLVYESGWGGVTSSASYVTGNSGADFGNTYYNDHHFHYGYFVYTAAVIGHLDPGWINENKAYVNMLVRDISNPSAKDPYFPVSRCFDWFHGHSWAHGLFDSLDGKDQESSSEDTMHTYSIMLWGLVSGDQNMAARGRLMLAIQARAMRDYYLYSSDNKVQPKEFVGNKAAGILFENKIDHTTYFGTNVEYIQGIHMLPLLPHTPFVRTPTFVEEEWDTYFSKGRADAVVGGWKGILFGNYATIDPQGAYKFFSSPDFDPGWLDGGASLTWYLCYAAALGGL